MEIPNKFIPSPGMRRWLYAVLVAVGALLVATGAIDGTLWESIDRLLMALLMIGSGATAMANVPGPVTVIEPEVDA